jgi:hypothetical protein
MRDTEEDIEEWLNSTTDGLVSYMCSKILYLRQTSSDLILVILRSLISLGYSSELRDAISAIAREGRWKDSEEDYLEMISSSQKHPIIDIKYL